MKGKVSTRIFKRNSGVSKSAKTKGKPLQLTVQSRTEKLMTIREFVSKAARKFGFDEDETNKIALAVDEACTNIIKHAYNYAPDKPIDVKITMRDGKFEVTIEDEGKSFNPHVISIPNMKEYLSHYTKGGLGMFLMKSLMDKVEYLITPGAKNRVRLVKFLQKA